MRSAPDGTTGVNSAAARTTVCIAGEQPVYRHGLRQIIEADAGFRVVGEAGDGLTALTQMQRVLPDVAIIDAGLPQLGGVALVHSLSRLEPAPACLVVAEDAHEATFNAALDAGAAGYILKAEAPELVLSAVKAVAAGTVSFSRSVAGWLRRREERAEVLRRERAGLGSLTAVEQRVLRLVGENRTNREIGRELFISHRTVEAHRSNICRKLDLKGAHALLHFAVQHRSEL